MCGTTAHAAITETPTAVITTSLCGLICLDGDQYAGDQEWKKEVVKWVILNDHLENLIRAASMQGTLEELKDAPGFAGVEGKDDAWCVV